MAPLKIWEALSICWALINSPALWVNVWALIKWLEKFEAPKVRSLFPNSANLTVILTQDKPMSESQRPIGGVTEGVSGLLWVKRVVAGVSSTTSCSTVSWRRLDFESEASLRARGRGGQCHTQTSLSQVQGMQTPLIYIWLMDQSAYVINPAIQPHTLT